ncbi:MAG: permease [Desulfobacterales bacterium]
MKERTKLLILIGIYVICYYVPWDHPTIRQSGLEAFMMLREYAREHVLTCLIPAFFIAGAISVFVSQASVLKYFGAQAGKILSYGVASISGTILVVCSCNKSFLCLRGFTQEAQALARPRLFCIPARPSMCWPLP